MALPNPFQNTALPSPVLNTVPKITQNETTLFHGYRSNFDINQQKQEYEQRIRQQTEQQAKFNRNVQPRNNRHEKPNYGTESHNYCELCECKFKYPYQLEKHLNEHEKCWFDNCTFEGSSMLLKNHIETQHQSGLFQRISKIETEEDIEKWREERRKRYPTKANIEARRLAQEERLKRGERIQEPNHRFGSIQNRKSAQQRSFTQNQNDPMKTPDKKKNDRKRRRTRNKQRKDDREKTTPNDKTVAAKIDSVKSVANSDVATVKQCPASPKEKTVPTTNALATIMGMYGTDSDSDCDDDDADAVATITTATAATAAAFVATKTATTMSEYKQPDNKQEEHVCNITDNVTAASDPISEAIESSKHCAAVDVAAGDLIKNRKRSVYTDDELLPIKQLKIDSNDEQQTESIDQSKENESDDDAPDEQPIQRQTNDLQEAPEKISGPTGIRKPFEKKKIDKITKKRTILDMTRKIRNQNTLLEKLLQKDIRHERNVLLQCVRYVVENNFFGIGQKTDEQNNRIENS